MARARGDSPKTSRAKEQPSAKAVDVRRALREKADPEIVKNLKWFFKTGPGEYGEGDKFIGIKAPPLRAIQKKYRNLPLEDALSFVQSEYHEERWLGLLYLTDIYKRGDEKIRARVFKAYLANTKHINNWDLVDLSAPGIIGAHLFERDRKRLFTLARSRDLWKRRIAIMATLYFIREKDFNTTLELADILLLDEQDLIRKAVGWMLREVGNRDRRVEEKYLKSRYKKMPRTMLRYAIEKFPETLRKRYLTGNV